MMYGALPFREIWAVDFEFAAQPGERPDPICLVAKELKTGRTLKLWRDEFRDFPPYATDANTLFIAYYASAELGCHRTLKWPQPKRICDLFCEFRNRTNGLGTAHGAGLLGALAYFGIDHIDITEKRAMQELAARGGPWSGDERKAFLDYCESDVVALERLFPKMLAKIDLPRALLRGRGMSAASAMEHNGIPMDVPMLNLMLPNFPNIKGGLITEIDRYGVYEGSTFKNARWDALMASAGVPWPRLEDGHTPDLSDDTFRQLAKSYPIVAPYRELRHSLSGLKLTDLSVGHDGRNRVLLSAFRSRTGRFQPSNSRYVFGTSTWLRHLIRPEPGFAVCYLDFSQQEFAIASVLSGDLAMQAAYLSGDPYLSFAKQAHAVPEDATKESCGPQRELFKQCALALLYGMEENSLAFKIGQPPIVARNLIRAHHETFKQFWRWSDAVVDHALTHQCLQTVFGWQLHIGSEPNLRSLRNYPMQANGAEMLRLACCLATERGIEVCAPVHDALLIHSPIDRIEDDVCRAKAAMQEASKIVLNGFEVRVDAKIVRYPHRFTDPRGVAMWEAVSKLVRKAAAEKGQALA